ncbi:MAG: class I tRNA ligase family protein, partial [Oscillospiraceae bacterium]|nr:class I tRNA ligase family protein [Oscillospiraceae bacterium]
IDPLEMIEQFGSDALRMNMITNNSPGNDMRFYVERCEAMRNFANKIWNASRYVMMNLQIEKNELPDLNELELSDKWILSKLNTTIAEVTENLEKYELGVAVSKVYDFIWDSYCDWYIELTKARLYSENEQSKLVAQKVLLYVLDQFLRLLHPFMPFLSEEIWQAIPHEGEALIIAKWPEYSEALNFKTEEAAMESVMNAIRAIRNRRAEMNVPPSKKCTVYIVTENTAVYESGIPFFLRLASAEQVEVLTTEPENHEGMASCVTADAKLYMPMSQLVDKEKELARVTKEKEKVAQDIARTEGKLSNEKFISKAPEAVVNQEREKLARIKALYAQLCEAEDRLNKL